MSLFPVLANPSAPATRENSPSPNSNPSATRILQAALEILLQGESLLEGLSREAYSQRSPLVFQASIGGHYRHCLDHFELAIASADGNPLNYDHRTRDPRLEVDLGFALERTRELRAHIGKIDPADLTREIGVRCEVSYVAGDAPETRSTLARELVYAITHGIHHYALIAVIARLAGVRLPEHFGIAPSTVAHQASSPPMR